MKLFFLLLLLSISGYSQQLLQGIIIDGNLKQPLAGANVFVANSTYKTVTNDAGLFFLQIPEGNYEVVVTHVGYSPVMATSRSFYDLDKKYTIELFPEIEQLPAVSVMSEKTRAKYLKLFVEKLIGTSKNADKTIILNLDQANVEYDEATKTMTVSAFEPLQIENRELNYKLTFVLSHFKLDMHSGMSNYSGYPLFEDLLPITSKNAKRVEKNRLRAYQGSVMHFIRSVYDAKLGDAGFVVDNFSVRENPAYPGIDSVRAIIELSKKTLNPSLMYHIPPRDLITFSKHNMAAKDLIVEEQGKKFLHFTDFLQVIYKNEDEEPAYGQRYLTMDTQRQVSQLKSAIAQIEIFASGNYADANQLVLHGYMGWEKLADMVPFNYLPPTPEN